MNFKELNIMPSILKALSDENYTLPTPIQEQAIPPILNGRDLLGCAQTGTGKTAAFAVPTLQLLSEERTASTGKRHIRALVLAPTRELALQNFECFNMYGKYIGLRSCAVFGGVSQVHQVEMLKKGVDILIATPGRLNDLINQHLVNLQHIKIFILDEADRMLDMGFICDVKKIITKMPAKKQTLLFSATMPPEISKIAGSLLKDPVKIAISPISSPVDVIEQFVYFVDKENKRDLLLNILKDKSVVSALVFTRTKYGADRVERELVKNKIKAQAIHGNKSQSARQLALKNFKNKVTRVLVATDIAARGIDIDELSHVINFDLPETPETYVHRIGRTGRAGLGGTAISFCDIDEKPLLIGIEKFIGKRITEVKNHPYPMLITTPHPKNAASRRRPSAAAHTGKPGHTKFENKRQTQQKRTAKAKAANWGEKNAHASRNRKSYSRKG